MEQDLLNQGKLFHSWCLLSEPLESVELEEPGAPVAPVALEQSDKFEAPVVLEGSVDCRECYLERSAGPAPRASETVLPSPSALGAQPVFERLINTPPAN